MIKRTMTTWIFLLTKASIDRYEFLFLFTYNNFFSIVAFDESKGHVTCQSGFYDCVQSNFNVTDPGAVCEIACGGCMINFLSGILMAFALLAFFLTK